MSKLKYEDIVKEVQEAGWQLLTPSYTNLDEDMSFQCPQGHTNYYSLKIWRKNHKCVTCENNPLFKVSQTPVKKKGFRVFAIDQATNTSGWCIFDDEELISYGHWTSEGKHSTERIGQTKYWMASMIEKWNPDFLALEDIFLQTYSSSHGGESNAVVTYKKLAQLQGVLKNYAFEIGLPYEIVPAATWRAYSEVKGKYSLDRKKNAQLKIKNLYHVDVTYDEADSILIGRYVANQHSQIKTISFL